ncbi:MAG: TonB family protein [Gammaproteobacteria bacterium]
MNDFTHMPVVTRLGWTLIHLLWQGAAAGLVYFCLRNLLQRRSPQARYVLALMALVTLALLPLFTFFYLSGWNSPHLHMPSPLRINFMAATTNTEQITLPQTPAERFTPLVSWAVILWLAGVAFMGARAVWGWRKAGMLRIALPSTPVHPWQPLLHDLAERMHIKRATSLLASTQVYAPTVVGWLKPIILIPPSAVCGLSWQQAEMILVHELAHIRRHDYLFNLLQVVLETLLFYHPVVHWISRDARNEREFCCDDVVMETCGDRVAYLKALAELESRRLHAPLTLASNGGMLLNRAYRLAHQTEPVGRPSGESVVLLALAVLITAVVLIHPHSRLPVLPANKVPMARMTMMPEIHTAAMRVPRSAADAEALAAPVLAPTRFAPAHAATMQRVKLLQIFLSMQAVMPVTSLPAPEPAVSHVVDKPVAPATVKVVAAQPLPTPGYPYQALRDDLDGVVQASFQVSKTGDTTDIQTEMTKGPMVLATSVRGALENWKFKPVRFNGRTITPHVHLEFVFTANQTNKATGNCVIVTGSHICHWYQVGIPNIQVQESESGITSAVVSGSGNGTLKGDVMVKLADAEGKNALVCGPNDACFFARNGATPERRQRIETQIRMLSEGLIPGYMSP